MDGVAVVLSVLTADVALLALVPNDRIAAGVLPTGTALPAISVTSVSKVDRNILAPTDNRHVVERVQVTVLAPNYPSQKAVLRAVRHAAADRIDAVIAGISGVTIHTESAGPDFMNEAATIYIGSQDFRVAYSEPR